MELLPESTYAPNVNLGNANKDISGLHLVPNNNLEGNASPNVASKFADVSLNPPHSFMPPISSPTSATPNAYNINPVMSQSNAVLPNQRIVPEASLPPKVPLRMSATQHHLSSNNEVASSTASILSQFPSRSSPLLNGQSSQPATARIDTLSEPSSRQHSPSPSSRAPENKLASIPKVASEPLLSSNEELVHQIRHSPALASKDGTSGMRTTGSIGSSQSLDKLCDSSHQIDPNSASENSLEHKSDPSTLANATPETGVINARLTMQSSSDSSLTGGSLSILESERPNESTQTMLVHEASSLPPKSDQSQNELTLDASVSHSTSSNTLQDLPSHLESSNDTQESLDASTIQSKTQSSEILTHNSTSDSSPRIGISQLHSKRYLRPDHRSLPPAGFHPPSGDSRFGSSFHTQSVGHQPLLGTGNVYGTPIMTPPQPSIGLPQPSMGLPQPSMGILQPSMGILQPLKGLLQPSMGPPPPHGIENATPKGPPLLSDPQTVVSPLHTSKKYPSASPNFQPNFGSPTPFGDSSMVGHPSSFPTRPVGPQSYIANQTAYGSFSPLGPQQVSANASPNLVGSLSTSFHSPIIPSHAGVPLPYSSIGPPPKVMGIQPAFEVKPNAPPPLSFSSPAFSNSSTVLGSSAFTYSPSAVASTSSIVSNPPGINMVPSPSLGSQRFTPPLSASLGPPTAALGQISGPLRPNAGMGSMFGPSSPQGAPPSSALGPPPASIGPPPKSFSPAPVTVGPPPKSISPSLASVGQLSTSMVSQTPVGSLPTSTNTNAMSIGLSQSHSLIKTPIASIVQSSISSNQPEQSKVAPPPISCLDSTPTSMVTSLHSASESVSPTIDPSQPTSSLSSMIPLSNSSIDPLPPSSINQANSPTISPLPLQLSTSTQGAPSSSIGSRQSLPIVPPHSSSSIGQSSHLPVVPPPSYFGASQTATIVPPPTNTMVPPSPSSFGPPPMAMVPPPITSFVPPPAAMVPPPTTSFGPPPMAIVPPSTASSRPLPAGMIPPPTSSFGPPPTAMLPPPTSSFGQPPTAMPPTAMPPPAASFGQPSTSSFGPPPTAMVPPPTTSFGPALTAMVSPPTTSFGPPQTAIVPSSTASFRPLPAGMVPPPTSSFGPPPTAMVPPAPSASMRPSRLITSVQTSPVGPPGLHGPMGAPPMSVGSPMAVGMASIRPPPMSFGQPMPGSIPPSPSVGPPPVSIAPPPKSMGGRPSFPASPITTAPSPSQPGINSPSTNNSMYSNRSISSPSQPTDQRWGDPLSQQLGGLSVTQHGWNKGWGTAPIDLLQQRIVLPPEGVTPPKPLLAQPHLINCSPDIFRSTLTKVPESQSILQKSRLPFGILIHPFKDLEHLAVVSCNTIVRCRSCRTYINPFICFKSDRRWECNLCFRVNDLPDEFQFDPITRTFGDPSRRPEVKEATIEFIAPGEYMLRPPQPAAYLYILEVSRQAVDTGYLQVACDTLLTYLEKIPGDRRTMIGFITFSETLQFYLMDGCGKVQMLEVGDVEDVFLPCPQDLLVNLEECLSSVEDLLTTLPEIHAKTTRTRSALGPALMAAYKLLAAIGGRITVMTASLPSVGPGSLKPREDPNQRAAKEISHLGPATDFYKRLALDCSGQQIAVDLFTFNSQYADLGTLSGISKFSGGCINHFPGFHISSNLPVVEHFKSCFTRYITRKIGLEAVMRIRATRGIVISNFHGNFFVRSTDLLSLPNINPDAGFGMQVTIDEPLVNLRYACFQAALLYTSSRGERRIRVHTLCLPISPNVHEIINCGDQQAIIGLLSKMAVDKCFTSQMSDAREAVVNACTDALSAFKISLSSFVGLPAPPTLQLLPMYCLALLKSVALRYGTSTKLDDRVFAMCEMKTLPLKHLMTTIYPDLYAIHNLTEEGAIDVDDIVVPQPARMQLSSEFIDRNGAFLMDVGSVIYVYIRSGVPVEWIVQVLDVPSFAAIPQPLFKDPFPVLDNRASELVRNFVGYLQRNKPYFTPIFIIKEDNPSRNLFIQNLVDDRAESSHSYVEFIQYIKAQVK